MAQFDADKDMRFVVAGVAIVKFGDGAPAQGLAEAAEAAFDFATTVISESEFYEITVGWLGGHQALSSKVASHNGRYF